MKRVATWVDELAAQHALSPRMVIVILIAPLLLAFVTALALLVPATQAAARWVTGGEDRPVEVATVVALLLAGLLAVRRVLRAAKAREPRFVQLFFALFAVVMVFVAFTMVPSVRWSMAGSSLLIPYCTPVVCASSDRGYGPVHPYRVLLGSSAHVL